MIVALILAKGESRRLPRKNLREINGIPLFVHAINYAKRSKLVSRIIVTTDSDEIDKISRDHGVGVVRRGPELCGDATNAAVMSHAMSCELLNSDIVSHVVCLQPDHPGRQLPLDDALNYAINNSVDILLSVNKDGILSGSFRIYSGSAISHGYHNSVAHTMMDHCLDIHTEDDLNMARQEMVGGIINLTKEQ